jgi:hypothetical protein
MFPLLYNHLIFVFHFVLLVFTVYEHSGNADFKETPKAHIYGYFFFWKPNTHFSLLINIESKWFHAHCAPLLAHLAQVWTFSWGTLSKADVQWKSSVVQSIITVSQRLPESGRPSLRQHNLLGESWHNTFFMKKTPA